MTAKIASAFVKAQKAFNPALKTSINPHFKSRYVGLDGCVEAVIDALNDNGIALMQHTSECDNGVIVETIFLHESGETLNCGKLHVPASKMDAQGYGSALTYARRYSLMAACGIAPEDDDGNAASKKPQVITADQVANIVALATEVKANMIEFRKYLQVDRLENLPVEKYHAAIAALEKKRQMEDVPQ